MSLIQCKLGPAQPVVGGHTYVFAADKHGRYVCDVHSLVHQALFLSVEHYEIAPVIVDDPVETETDDDLDELVPFKGTPEVAITELPAILSTERPPTEASASAPVRRRGKRRS